MTALTGCRTAALSKSGATVRVSPSAPVDQGFDPGSCTVLGYLVGRGGGSFGGGYISNEELITYAMNDLRNQAAQRGANYVQHDSPQLGTSGGRNSVTTTTATVSGTAYQCTRRTAQRSATSAADPSARSVPAQPVDARLMELKTAEGKKKLRLLMTQERVVVALEATPELSTQIALVAKLRRKPLPADCSMAIAADGVRVAVSATVIDEKWHHANAVLALDDLASLAAAKRVAGRLCDEQYALTPQQLAALQDFLVRVRETTALLPPAAAGAAAQPASAAEQTEPAASAGTGTQPSP